MTADDLAIRPHIRSSLESLAIDGERLVLADGLVHRLDEIGSLLMPLFDGTATLEEIASDAADVFNLDRRDAASHLASFVRQLGRAGLLLGTEAATAPSDDPLTLSDPPSP